MTDLPVDKPGKENIVGDSQPHTKTPSDGAGNTDGGLTDHADETSMAADRNISPGSTSRQSLSAASDDFLVGKVEYYPPAEETVAAFVHAVLAEFGDLSNTEIRRGFRQFVDVLILIETKAANKRRGGGDGETEEKTEY